MTLLCDMSKGPLDKKIPVHQFFVPFTDKIINAFKWGGILDVDGFTWLPPRDLNRLLTKLLAWHFPPARATESPIYFVLCMVSRHLWNINDADFYLMKLWYGGTNGKTDNDLLKRVSDFIRFKYTPLFGESRWITNTISLFGVVYVFHPNGKKLG